ncbi:MAG: transposase [Tetrasphaera sp.]
MHSISDPSRVRFIGPLTPLAPGLAAELLALGYASTSATNQLQLAAHLSRWLQAHGLGPGELTEAVIAQFLVERRRDYAHLYSLQALGPTLGYLRHLGVAPAAHPMVPVGVEEEMLARFRNYLWTVPGLVDTGGVALSLKEFHVMGDTRRAFTAEYKSQAVGFVLDDDRTIAEVARNIGCHEYTLRFSHQAGVDRWV